MSNINIVISYTKRHPKQQYYNAYIHIRTGKDYIRCPCAWVFEISISSMCDFQTGNERQHIATWNMKERHFLDFNQILNVQPRMFNVFGYDSGKVLFRGCYVINHINKYCEVAIKLMNAYIMYTKEWKWNIKKSIFMHDKRSNGLNCILAVH